MGNQEELRAAIRELAVEGRAPCRRLLELAERTGTPSRDIGRLCDEMKIRITSCQLGCFQ